MASFRTQEDRDRESCGCEPAHYGSTRDAAEALIGGGYSIRIAPRDPPTALPIVCNHPVAIYPSSPYRRWSESLSVLISDTVSYGKDYACCVLLATGVKPDDCPCGWRGGCSSVALPIAGWCGGCRFYLR